MTRPTTKPEFLQSLCSKGFSIQHDDERPFYRATKDTKTVNFTIRQKSKPVWGIKTKRYEYSIPLREWEDYRSMTDNFFVFVADKSTAKIYGSSIRDLEPLVSRYYGNKLDDGGTAFFPRDSMKTL